MKNRFLIPILIAVSSASATAGYKLTANVSVLANTRAMGAMGTARNSADSLQYIGCELYATTSYSNLHCHARDAGGNSFSCWQNAAEHDHMRQVVTSLNDNAWLRFDADPAALNPSLCTWVQAHTSSKYAPPQL